MFITMIIRKQYTRQTCKRYLVTVRKKNEIEQKSINLQQCSIQVKRLKQSRISREKDVFLTNLTKFIQFCPQKFLLGDAAASPAPTALKPKHLYSFFYPSTRITSYPCPSPRHCAKATQLFA